MPCPSHGLTALTPTRACAAVSWGMSWHYAPLGILLNYFAITMPLKDWRLSTPVSDWRMQVPARSPHAAAAIGAAVATLMLGRNRPGRARRPCADVVHRALRLQHRRRHVRLARALPDQTL